ncbi:DUF5063 domain-containing protein [Deinococcus alpinitundrae]|uniref:DUF5063 domain-containing protein n=1 Tax=Deinococcus alpinitundrae TaxID=468913 RepID=UPI001ED90DEF|nr:DUF5063 domain-containing protein [Deinococcus alpinitundrae]
MTHIVAPAFELFVERRDASLLELDYALLAVVSVAEGFPNNFGWPEEFQSKLKYETLRAEISRQWPELGFYAKDPGEELGEQFSSVGDAIDDLTDIALALGRSLEIAHVNNSGAVSRLRFGYDTHWCHHAADLRKHLNWLLNK